MRGVIDPVTLAFILTVVGGVAVLSVESSDPADQLEQQTTNQTLDTHQQALLSAQD
jgi:hypothetical protein